MKHLLMTVALGLVTPAYALAVVGEAVPIYTEDQLSVWFTTNQHLRQVKADPDNSNQNYGKAGRMRHKGIRPSVRGVVMNPIDHPHGGGEGRTSGGRHPVTPWGKPTKGAKTRTNKSTDKYIIRSRHAKKKGR